MPIPAILSFDTKTALIETAAENAELILRNSVSERQQAILLAAGGSTPGPVYEALSTRQLPWSSISLGLTDERWVAPSSPASNEKLVRETFADALAAGLTFIPMVTDANLDPESQVSQIASTYMAICQAPDLIVLGMGSDAHTLSWFAGAQGISAAMAPSAVSPIAAITAEESAVTGPNTQRITLTRPVISAARHVLLLITGAEKRRALETSSAETPVQHMIAAAGNRLSIYWSP
ncbi:MAG: 6-phosphogluconolactonase [Pseudomonadota bacterium]